MWQDERKLVAKEVSQNVYSLDTYFWAKTLTVFPVEAFFSLVVRPTPPSADEDINQLGVCAAQFDRTLHVWLVGNRPLKDINRVCAAQFDLPHGAPR